jgi:hypothetical protein
MTDSEIIKALECCNTAKTEHHCDICPFYEYEKCTVSMLDSAVDLIKRQSAELDDLKRDTVPRLEWALKRANEIGLSLDKENQKLKVEIYRVREYDANLIRLNTALSNGVLEVKNEGIKDFAERLKKRCVFSQSNLKGYKMRVIDTESIDELVKEMTEGGVNYE